MNAFHATITSVLPEGLTSDRIDTVQINLGRYCNLACKHCHLECSPHSKEMMSWETMQGVLAAIHGHAFRMVDVTGGSPDLHPHFRKFIEKLIDCGQTVQVRTNLVSLTESTVRGIAEFLRERGVSLVGSLPCYLEENVNEQRGSGTFTRSIEAIRMLNDLGYGRGGGLSLNLVHNPIGPFLPGEQSDLEEAYRYELMHRFGITFDRLLVLTNMPIGRFKRELEESGKWHEYMTCLKCNFNPATLAGLMCRRQVSIDWNGTVYDCDFNLALGIPVNLGSHNHIQHFDAAAFDKRRIATGDHCFGCTAGAGSSCGGSITREGDNIQAALNG